MHIDGNIIACIISFLLGCFVSHIISAITIDRISSSSSHWGDLHG